MQSRSALQGANYWDQQHSLPESLLTAIQSQEIELRIEPRFSNAGYRILTPRLNTCSNTKEFDETSSFRK